MRTRVSLYYPNPPIVDAGMSSAKYLRGEYTLLKELADRLLNACTEQPERVSQAGKG